ncbi:MAG: oligosaccharide flippase family protein [Vicinamibacteria bacterium]
MPSIRSRGTDPPAGLPPRREPVSLARNLTASAGAKAFYVLTRFFIPPLVLAHISLEEYGIWSACFVLVGYVGMTTFGVSNVYIRYAARYQARGEQHRIAEMFTTGVTTTLAIGLVVLAGLGFLLPSLVRWFKVSPPLQERAAHLFLATVAVFVADLSLGAAAYLLHGLQRIALANVIWSVAVTVETLSIVLLLWLGWGVWALLAALVVRYTISIGASWIACRRLVPGLGLHPRSFRREYLKEFVRYGGIVQASGMLSMFLRSIEKLIAGVTLGAPAAGLMDLGEKLPGTAVSIPSAMNAALLPAAAHLDGGDRRAEVVALYVEGTRTVNLCTSFVMGFLAAFAWPLVVAWLGRRPETDVIALIMAVFTLPWHVNVVTGPASSVFRAIGEPARELFYPVSQLLLVAAAVGIGFTWSTPSLAVISFAVGSAMVASALLYLAYASHRLGVGQGRMARRTLLPGLVPYAVAGALLVAARPWLAGSLADRWSAVALLAPAGLAYVALTAAVLHRFVLDDAERAAVRRLYSRVAVPDVLRPRTEGA